MDVSQSSGCSKIRTAPISGGFLIDSTISSFSRFLSLRIIGSLAAWGTENLFLSGESFILSVCSVSSVVSIASKIRRVSREARVFVAKVLYAAGRKGLFRVGVVSCCG